MGCLQAGSDLVDVRLKLWSPDRCANAVLAPTLRPDEHSPGGENFEPLEAGFFDVRSAHPIRAVAVLNPQNDQEVCRIHYGKMTIGSDGFARPMFCSKWTGSDSGRATGLGYLFIASGANPPNNLVDPGDAAFLSAYETPVITEAHLSSNVVLCSQIL